MSTAAMPLSCYQSWLVMIERWIVQLPQLIVHAKYSSELPLRYPEKDVGCSMHSEKGFISANVCPLSFYNGPIHKRFPMSFKL